MLCSSNTSGPRKSSSTSPSRYYIQRLSDTQSTIPSKKALYRPVFVGNMLYADTLRVKNDALLANCVRQFALLMLLQLKQRSAKMEAGGPQDMTLI